MKPPGRQDLQESQVQPYGPDDRLSEVDVEHIIDDTDPDDRLTEVGVDKFEFFEDGEEDSRADSGKRLDRQPQLPAIDVASW